MIKQAKIVQTLSVWSSLHLTLTRQRFSFLAAALVLLGSLLGAAPVEAAACPAPATNYGSATTTVSVPSSATYRIWSRIMAPDTTNNTYLLEIDGVGGSDNCYSVGGGSIPASTWTWVDYQGGNSSSAIDVPLSTGSYTFKMIGNAPGVKLDRIVLTGDTSCLPTGTGDNCANPPDKTSPTVSLTSPASGATISGKYTLNATAQDDSGTVSKVEFYADSNLVGTSATTPFSYALNTTTLTNGSHSLTAKAYDPSGNVGTSSAVTVNVNNTSSTPTETTAPTVSITAPADGNTVSGSVTVTANASDNVGVTKVDFIVDGTTASTVQTAPYSYKWNTTAVQNGSHSLSVKAYDAAGNTSTDSVSVTVQNGDSQAPSVPAGLQGSAAAYNKVNLTWTASTDSVGVSGYYVIRNGVTVAQVGAVTSYSDTAVTASTQYKYQLEAFDAAGNVSAASAAATVTTPAAPDTTPPSAPGSLKAAAVNTTQINVTWTASTDNIGVSGYDVYRAVGSAATTKVATITTTSFGDSGLSAGTAYTYYVIAKDAAGNQSAHSATASATTLPTPPTSIGTITGTISGRSGKALANGRVSLTFNNSWQIYTTDASGTYTIPGIPAGTYTLRYSARHYRSERATITVTAGQTTTKNVSLRHR